MRSTTGGQHNFATVPRADIQRSVFNRSCGYKTTFDAGWLIPVFLDEALPGDTMTMRMHTFGRLATPIVAPMDNLYLDSFFFAVPIRLVWDNFQRFMGEQPNPGDSTDFTVPTITSPASTGYAEGSLSDYMGIPTKVPDMEHSALWHRAYHLIWNEWFRDQNLQNSVGVATDDGPDLPTDYALQRRGKRHDYFTSALPWPQKGTAVSLPLGTTAPLQTTGDAKPLFETTSDTGMNIQHFNASQSVVMDTIASGGTLDLQWDDPKLEVDLTTATAATINQLRESFQIQRLYERDARGGSRYTEIVRSHFGVVSPDQRLQRPEFLGGGSQNISINPVPQTSSTDTNGARGQVGAFGTTAGSGHTFAKSFTEHCLIVGLVCLRADLNYQQGLDRMFSRSTRFDFYWPALAHLGEQAILNKEIYAQGTAADDTVWGYQERYAEYRYKPSKVTGHFRSNHSTSLDLWHLAQEFGSLPALDSDFIVENPPVDRISAVAGEPDLMFDAFFDFKCARPMPTYSVPGLIDHF